MAFLLYIHLGSYLAISTLYSRFSGSIYLCAPTPQAPVRYSTIEPASTGLVIYSNCSPHNRFTPRSRYIPQLLHTCNAQPKILLEACSDTVVQRTRVHTISSNEFVPSTGHTLLYPFQSDAPDIERRLKTMRPITGAWLSPILRP
jgi:hypothetical protein